MSRELLGRSHKAVCVAYKRVITDPHSRRIDPSQPVGYTATIRRIYTPTTSRPRCDEDLLYLAKCGSHYAPCHSYSDGHIGSISDMTSSFKRSINLSFRRLLGETLCSFDFTATLKVREYVPTLKPEGNLRIRAYINSPSSQSFFQQRPPTADQVCKFSDLFGIPSHLPRKHVAGLPPSQ
jgi:hypothetical protein